MDEFERKLAVALKTATRELPSAVSATSAQPARLDHTPAPPRPRRLRLVLVTAVVVALALVVSGSWWAINRETSPTPPGDAACDADDLRLTREAPTAGESEVLTVIAVTARSACVLSEPPTVTFRDQDVPWQSLHGARWADPALAVDATLRFALSTTIPGSRGPGCEGVTRMPRTVEARVGPEGPAPLTFDLGESPCGPVSLTLYGPGAVDGSPCTAADVALAREGTPPPGEHLVLGLVGLRVSRACTLTTPPTMTTGGAALPFEATPSDPADDGSWQAIALESGATAQFAVTQLPVTSGIVCTGPVTHAELTVSYAGGATGTVALGVDYGACGGRLAETTYTPADAVTACSAADVQVVPRDIGQLGGAVGIDVMAVRACELDRAPTVTLADRNPTGRAVTVPFAADPERASSAWSPVTLERGRSARFEVALRTVAVSCPPSAVEVTVGTAVGGDQLSSFIWVAHACGLDLNVVTFYWSPPAAMPCTADDVDVRHSVGPSSATLTVVSHDNARCTLVDPPTVLANGTLAPNWSSPDPGAAQVWTPVVVQPGRDLRLTVVFTETRTDCPRTARDLDVLVGIDTATVAAFTWTAHACDDGLLVTVPG